MTQPLTDICHYTDERGRPGVELTYAETREYAPLIVDLQPNGTTQYRVGTGRGAEVIVEVVPARTRSGTVDFANLFDFDGPSDADGHAEYAYQNVHPSLRATFAEVRTQASDHTTVGDWADPLDEPDWRIHL